MTGCNCPDIKCTVHPDLLCSNDATSEWCENCQQYHTFGDGILGDGISLCDDCTTAMIKFLLIDTRNCMAAVKDFMPARLNSTVYALGCFWEDNLNNPPWHTMTSGIASALELILFACENERMPLQLKQHTICHCEHASALLLALKGGPHA